MSKEKLEMIPLAKIKADQKKNPRKKEDKIAFEELVKSINEKGVVVPVIVMPDNNHYNLVCGFRRFKAVQVLKMDTIPAIVRDDLDEKGAAEIRTIENLQREDLDILDEAAGFKQLLSDFDWRVEDIAEKIGKSETYIQKRLAILKSPDYIKKAVVENRITPGHAMLLNNIQDEGERKELLKQIGWGRWSVKELYKNISKNDRRINRNTPFDITKCQDCKWLGLKQKQLPLEDLGKGITGQDVCFNKACYQKKMQIGFNEKLKDLKRRGLPVEILETTQSPNWRWEDFSKHTKKDLVDPEKCKDCPEHVIIVNKIWGGGFNVQETCKKGGCKNWKANLKTSQETKGEREKKKKENEKKDVMVKEILEKIDQNKVNLLVIGELIDGGYAGISPPYRAFAKIFEIDVTGFPKYRWGEPLMEQIAKRDPMLYPEMIKTLIVLKFRYAMDLKLQNLHKEVVGANLRQKIKKEMVIPEKKPAIIKKRVKSKK